MEDKPPITQDRTMVRKMAKITSAAPAVNGRKDFEAQSAAGWEL